MNRPLQKLIHVGCRELGLDKEARHDLQLLVTGKASQSDMSDGELEAVVQALKDRGFTVKATAAKVGHNRARRPTSDRADIRLCHVLWKLLAQSGHIKVSGAKGLNAFIRERFETTWGSVPIDVDALRDEGQINDVVQALKAMCARHKVAGYDPKKIGGRHSSRPIASLLEGG